MMGHREKTKANERAVFSGWRKVTKYMRKPGRVHYWKKLFSRRVRKEAKIDPARAADD
ncbi:hypothetical protein GOC14_06935 [Sinorhizobium meliloti]|nr:hypothetical protein [Sinorhizobium meliloti]